MRANAHLRSVNTQNHFGSGIAELIRKWPAKGSETVNIRHILFPIDFSDHCAAVVPHVAAAARRFNAAVTLLHLVEPQVLPYGPVETFAFPTLQPAALNAKAEERLDTFGPPDLDGLRVRRVVETGDPALSIATLARDWGIGLIMMPTRGRGGFRAALLGSVTAKVLHDAACPVWTAAHAETLGSSQHTEWRNIVCALGLSPSSAHLLQAARDLHETIGATIHLVHVVPGEEAFPQRLWNQEFESVLRQQASENIMEMQGAAGTKFEVSIEAGKVSRAVCAYARKLDADLVLAGRGHTYTIIRDAGCPVLSL